MDNRPLKTKALEMAVNDIKKAVTPKQANILYKFWEVFHNEFAFKQAVRDKQQYFKKRRSSRIDKGRFKITF